MQSITFRNGATASAIGQGTWKMTDGSYDRAETIRALRRGVDLGMTLIDTAEVYGDGEVELLVAEALADRRDEIFLVSKLAPFNATRSGAMNACESSLRRLNTDRLDLYLLHWTGDVPLEETVAGLNDLVEIGKIDSWGVSNFDLSDMKALMAAGGEACVANQIQFNPEYSGARTDLVPWMAERGIVTMAYSPLGAGSDLLADETIVKMAQLNDVTPASVALAWALAQPLTMVIPKASTVRHVEANAVDADFRLTTAAVREIDRAFEDRARAFFYR